MQCSCTKEYDPVLNSKDVWDKEMTLSVVKSAHARPEDLNSTSGGLQHLKLELQGTQYL